MQGIGLIDLSTGKPFGTQNNPGFIQLTGSNATDGTQTPQVPWQGYSDGQWVNVRIGDGKPREYHGSLAGSAGAAGAVWTPASGKKFRLLTFQVSTDFSGEVLLVDGTLGVGTEIWRMNMTASMPVTIPIGPNGVLSFTANNVLNVYNNSSTTGNVYVFATGDEE